MELIKYLGEYGLAAVVLVILFTMVLPKLDKIRDTLADIGMVVTLLITSLPEIKKRTKEEAERLRGRFDDK